MKGIRKVCFSVMVVVVFVGAASSAMAYYAEGLAQYKQGDTAGAATTLANGLAEGPDNPDARYLLGLCYNKLGEYEKAKVAFAAVVEARPDYAKAHTNLARALLKLEAYDEAVVEASKGVELLGDTGAYNVLGLAYLGKEQFNAADAAFAKSIEQDPSNAWAYNNRGYALILKGGENAGAVAGQALELFNKALELSPGNEVFQRNKKFAERVLSEQ